MSVSVINNILPLDLINDIKSDYDSRIPERVNHSSWEEGLVRDSKLVFINELDTTDKSLINKLLKEKIPEINDADDFYISYNRYSKYSYLPFHADSKALIAVTIYLTDDNRSFDDGGFFVYEKTENDFRLIVPRFNTAVCIKPPLRHSVTPYIGDGLRSSIQCFYSKI